MLRPGPYYNCGQCPLNGGGHADPYGVKGYSFALIGEGPGREEAFRGVPFVGDAGKELDRYIQWVGLNERDFLITNTVQCRPPNNRDPYPDEIAMCSPHTVDLLSKMKPGIIILAGKIAVETFLERGDLDKIHGIPQKSERFPWATVIPIYHPAAGLHQTFIKEHCRRDWENVKKVIEGKSIKESIILPSGDVPLMAVDTESFSDERPLSVQYCTRMFKGNIIYANDDTSLKGLKTVLEGEVEVIFHNAMYDLTVLDKMDIHPPKWTDTMVMAYLLQYPPQKLKHLAYRFLGMEMRDYLEVIREPQERLALQYLEEVVQRDWPDPSLELEWKADGEVKIRKPQNIKKKVNRLLKDYAKGGPYGADVDLLGRWERMDGKEIVEVELGPLPQADLSMVSQKEREDYACADPDATLQVYPILKKEIEELGLQEALRMDLGIIPVVIQMETTGIKIDPDTFAELDVEFSKKMEEIENEIDSIAGKHINLGSSDQVGEFLFETLGLENKGGKSNKKKKNKDKMSTAVDVLSRLRKDHPVVGKVLDWRGYNKLLNTYIRVIPTKAKVDGRIHSDFRTTNTATGRLASANPNLMAQPVRSEESRRIRNGFVASEGYTLVSFDYSQIEMRVLAHESQDALLLEIFWTGQDIHSITAARMFRIPVEEVDEIRHRYPAKRVGFGVVYGITGAGLLDQFIITGVEGWTEEECDELVVNWFEVYAGVKKYMEDVRNYARRNLLVRDMFGRIRRVPEVVSSIPRVVEAGLRQAGNFPIQGGAQGIIKRAMVALKPLCVKNNDIRPLIQIHDDLLFEIRDECLGWAVPLIKNVMETTTPLSIPTPVDAKMGKRWGSMEKIKEGWYES